ncbi:MAG: DNA repair protein RecO [Deltaproteobacteria bacterium]|nr:DNA repair protein RecO [Deltaproteobacteria bacterium]
MADEISQALILNRVLYSEKDLILTLLTRRFGVVSAIARSARGSKRRFGGALDLFLVFQASLRIKPPGRLSTLAGADPSRQFPGILESLERLETGQAMLAVTRDLLRDAPAGSATFDTLVEGFTALENSSSDDAHMAMVTLVMKLLAQIGHAPSSLLCPACQGSFAQGREAYLLSDGVVVCTDCASGQAGTPVRPDVLAACIGQGDLTSLPPRGESLAFLTVLMSSVLGRSYRIPLGDRPGSFMDGTPA